MKLNLLKQMSMTATFSGLGLGLINSKKYDGSNPNGATVGSSVHATGVP
jgi:hypothetical protein